MEVRKKSAVYRSPDDERTIHKPGLVLGSFNFHAQYANKSVREDHQYGGEDDVSVPGVGKVEGK